jgi:hypothetical protein
MNNHRPRTQRGMSINTMMIVIVLVVFFATLLFRLGPGYMSFWTMKSIMDEVAQSPEPILGGRVAIMKVLENRMMINNVRDVDAKSFTFTKNDDGNFDVTLAYEQRIHLFFNIDAVLTFDHTIVVKGQ